MANSSSTTESPTCECGLTLTPNTLDWYRGWVHERDCSRCGKTVERTETRYQCDTCVMLYDSKYLLCSSCFVSPPAFEPLALGTTVWNKRTSKYCKVDVDFDSTAKRCDVQVVEVMVELTGVDEDAEDGVTRFEVEVSFPNRRRGEGAEAASRHTVWRRYNEFCGLRKELQDQGKEHATKRFPPKTFGRCKGPGLENRRAFLEAWLQDGVARHLASLCTQPEQYWIDFLQIPADHLQPSYAN